MKRLRLTVALTGIGALLSGPAVCAQVLPSPDDGPASSSSTSAMTLLQHAAQAWGSRAWSGTQQVLTTRDGLPRLTVLRVSHTPGAGSAVQALTSADRAVSADVLDTTLLGLLAGHYDLRVSGRAWCAARRAVVVDARRTSPDGEGALAGRFWVDEATGLVLRRDVLDEAGSVVRSSSFVDLHVATSPATAPVSSPVSAVDAEVLHPTGQHLDHAALDTLADAGWPVVRTLPGQMELFDARLHDADGGDVVQLSYSDGLSTLSLFVQNGELPGGLSGRTRTMGGSPVLVSHDVLERVVWSGGGHTWTLVSDAPESVVDQAVVALPHATPRPHHDGLVPRVWRGMSRVGSWLNPFE